MAAKTITITGKIDVSKLVKATSRGVFQGNMPRPKRIGDKRSKRPRHGFKFDE